ncbi:MAG: hypothetical protein ACRDK9_06065 [Solirubrobacterales bacterium]
MRLRKLRPTPGVLIGVIALVFALTGAAIAAPKVTTNQIAKKAVTGPKIARDAVKSGKIVDGKIKERDLEEGIVPELAHGRVNKDGTTVNVAPGAVGITGASEGGDGIVCYDLAAAPTSGTATVVHEDVAEPGSTVELIVSPTAGCPAPFNDAQTVTKDSTDGAPVDEDVYVQFVG